ncbi:hypothetical protein ACWZJV_20925 [Nocardioides sp. WG-D5]
MITAHQAETLGGQPGFDVTQVVVAAEMDAATAWATRRGWILSYDPATKKGKALATHPVTGTTITFRFDTTGYPDRQPPAWWCGDEPTDPRNYPSGPSETKAGHPNGTIFHSQPVICAPWNRLAYNQVVPGAPHGDWTLAAWKTMAPEYTRAHTLGDMLAALELHLTLSSGMQVS